VLSNETAKQKEIECPLLMNQSYTLNAETSQMCLKQSEPSCFNDHSSFKIQIAFHDTNNLKLSPKKRLKHVEMPEECQNLKRFKSEKSAQESPDDLLFRALGCSYVTYIVDSTVLSCSVKNSPLFSPLNVHSRIDYFAKLVQKQGVVRVE
jgi:hypothetical protein